MSYEKMVLMALLYLVDATPAHKIGSALLSNILGSGGEHAQKQHLKHILEERIDKINKAEQLWKDVHDDETFI